MNCANCRFSTPKFNYEDHECRRHAPAMFKVDSCQDIRGFVPKWPIVKSRDWCGDYECRTPAEDQRWQHEVTGPWGGL